MKKLLSIVLCVTFSTSLLAGCGTSEEEPVASDAQVTTDAATPEAATPEAATTDGTVITLASFPDQPKAALEAAINAANLGFEVEIVEYPQNEYENKIKLAFGSDTSTDLVLMDAPNIASYAESGVLEPLNTYWPEEDFNDLVESSKETVVWNDQIWAAPLNESSTLLFYNKDVFDELGIVAPTSVADAWTFEELMDVCAKVTIPGERYAIQPQMFSLANKNEGQTYTQMLWSGMSGGTILSPDGTTATGYFDSEATKKGIQFYADLYSNGYASTEDMVNAFETGKVAMWVNGPWMIPIWENEFPDVNWGAMPMPMDVQGASGSGSWNIAISGSSEHKAEAYETVQALTGKEGMKVWCEETGNIPARKSVLDSLPMYKEYPYNIVNEQLATTAVTRPVTPVYPQISEAIMDCYNAVAFGEDVNKAVEEATAKINEALASAQ